MSEINVFSYVHKNIDSHKYPAMKLYEYMYIYTHDSFIAIPCASSRNYNLYLVLEYSQSVRMPELDLLSL